MVTVTPLTSSSVLLFMAASLTSLSGQCLDEQFIVEHLYLGVQPLVPLVLCQLLNGSQSAQ